MKKRGFRNSYSPRPSSSSSRAPTGQRAGYTGSSGFGYNDGFKWIDDPQIYGRLGVTSSSEMQSLVGALPVSPLLPRRVFIKDFLKAGRPVLFSDATDRWRARSRWTFEWFRDRFGDLPTQALAYAPGRAVSYTQRSRRCAIREIVEGAVSGTPTSDGQYLYIAEKLTRLPSELLADFEFPGYTQLRRLSITNLWLGPAGTFTDCHFDYGHNLFAQLVGRKRIQLWPFGTTFPSPAVPEGSLVAHVSEDGWPSDFGSPPVRPAFEIVIEPGEMLFIPYRCFHRVLGLEPSISINHFWWTLNVFAARAPIIAGLYARGRVRRWLSRTQPGPA